VTISFLLATLDYYLWTSDAPDMDSCAKELLLLGKQWRMFSAFGVRLFYVGSHLKKNFLLLQTPDLNPIILSRPSIEEISELRQLIIGIIEGKKK